ncbi:MAG: cold shock domain-containing protein [Breznakibacter sp.]
MATFNKRELEKKKERKRQEKQKRKEDRKTNGGSGSFEDMIAYVDENGVITSTPPDSTSKQVIATEDIVISTPKQEATVDPILTGRVQYFDEKKGYGFIRDTESAEVYFFHVSNAPTGIAEGAEVSFELEKGVKGLNAVRIELGK